MENSLYVVLFQPGDFFAPRTVMTQPEVILKCDLSKILHGDNSILHLENDLVANKILSKNGAFDIEEASYQFHYFSKKSRKLKKESELLFNKIFEEHGVVTSFNELMPAILVYLDKESSSVKLYHFNDTAWHGTLFLKYEDVSFNSLEGETDWALCINAMEKAYPRLLKYRHLFNDTCWYTRWNNGMELERKYTFNDIPDTWALNVALYQSVNINGDLDGFIPELDMSFQVFDYNNHIFEVLEPSSKGYISFIPQTNHKVAIKQKWFEENAELRKETILYDEDVSKENYEAKARDMAGGEVIRLAPFRRKRFDINFESLKTGNIFGVYFDICRSLEKPLDYAFSQCEVEYCRSRTLFEHKEVMEEYEKICSFVKKFLEQRNLKFQEDLYSKLDFARETHFELNRKGN